MALKEFVVKVQTKATSYEKEHSGNTESAISSRMKFMLEVILHIKNNNMSKIPNYDPTHLDHLRILLRSFTAGSTSGAELRVSLADLLSADEKGKWWLVGSAWSGRDMANTGAQDGSWRGSDLSQVNDKILELARKQRMNTDVRRNIFCEIMTSEDYAEAFERLLGLGLKEAQQKELVYVVMDTCLPQKRFNPFYAFLLQKLCTHERKFQRLVQFSLWDRLYELSSCRNLQIEILGRLTTHLIRHRALALAVFKVIEFADLDKHQLHYLRCTLRKLLLSADTDTLTQICTSLVAQPRLQQLVDALTLFFGHFLFKGDKGAQQTKKNTDESSESEKNRELLKERAGLVLKLLESKTSRVQM